MRDETELAGELDLAALRAAIARRRTWLVVPTVAAFVLIGLFVNIVTPRYTAESQVLLENQESFLTRPDRLQTSAPEANTLADPEAVGSQIQLITSRDLARRAIDRLHLAGNPEFDPLAGGLGPVRRALALIGVIPDPTRIPAEDRILEVFQQRLTVFSPSKTRVITIDFQSADPDLAARAANVVADLYMEMQSDAKRQSAKAAAASLSDEIAALRPKLAKANAEAEDFRSKNGLLAGTNNMTIVGQQLAELNTQLSQARTAQADAQAKAGVIRDMIKQGRVFEVPDVANNELVRRIIEQRVTLRAQLALESRTLLAQHPRIKELTAQLDDLDAQLRAIEEKTVRALENDARVAGARVANLQTALDQQKRVAGTANVDDVRLRELQRISDAYKDQLDSSMAKYQEAAARENSQSTPADARIISRAVAPQIPSFPKKVPTIVFGTVATFVAALAFIVSAELLSGRAQLPPVAPPVAPRPRAEPVAPTPLRTRLRAFTQSAAQARARAEAPVAAPRPDSRVEPALVAEPPRPADPAETIRQSHQAGHGARVVATSSVHAATDADRLATLARRLAGDGRAILVDMRDDVALLLHPEGGTARSLGLSDLLAGEASFAEVIHRDAASRLHFVPLGTTSLSDLRDFDLVLDALAETYDYLVLVAPAMNEDRLASDYAGRMEFTVLVASNADDATAREQLLAAGAVEVLMLGTTDGAAQHVA